MGDEEGYSGFLILVKVFIGIACVVLVAMFISATTEQNCLEKKIVRKAAVCTDGRYNGIDPVTGNCFINVETCIRPQEEGGTSIRRVRGPTNELVVLD